MDKFVAFKCIVDDNLTEYILCCSRINNNDPRRRDSLSGFLEMFEEDMRDLYEGGDMSLSFEVPSEAEGCVPFSEGEQSTIGRKFDQVLAACKADN